MASASHWVGFCHDLPTSFSTCTINPLWQRLVFYFFWICHSILWRVTHRKTMFTVVKILLVYVAMNYIPSTSPWRKCLPTVVWLLGSRQFHCLSHSPTARGTLSSRSISREVYMATSGGDFHPHWDLGVRSIPLGMNIDEARERHYRQTILLFFPPKEPALQIQRRSILLVI